MEPLASYSPHYAVIRDGGVEQATPQSQPQLQSQPGTTLPQPLPPTDPTNSQSPPTPDDMAPPPSYIAYRPSFEPFTTDQYMFPEAESWHLTEAERYQADNLVFEDIKIAESMLNPSHVPSSQRWWFSEFLPRICYEWCFWYDRSVTSEEVDARMNHLVANVLHQFHFIIVDPATRSRYSVWDLLESVRAVRDRLHPNTRGIRWDDEWP